MNCPVCDAKLREVTKMGVQVDICPDCKGVWLDRGELEKIVEYVEQGGAPQPAEPRREVYREEPRKDSRSYDHDHHQDDHHDNRRRYDDRGREIDPKTGRPKKKREGIWEIFDIFD